MVGDRTAIAQEQPRRFSRGRPAGDHRHPLTVQNGVVLAGRARRYGPRTTLYNRFTRWRAAGVWDRLLEAVSRTYDGDIVMIDSSCVRVHQHGAVGIKGGGCRSLHGTFERPPDNQDPCPSRCRGPSRTPRTHRRSRWRRANRHQAPRHRCARRQRARRQSLRHGRHSLLRHGAGRLG